MFLFAEAENPLEACDAPGMAAIEESANQYERLIARGGVNVTQRQFDRCQAECDFSVGSEGPDTIECLIPIVCPEEVANFLQCTEKNKNDYGSSACLSYGKALARKMGSAMGDLSVMMEKQGKRE